MVKKDLKKLLEQLSAMVNVEEADDEIIQDIRDKTLLLIKSYGTPNIPEGTTGAQLAILDTLLGLVMAEQTGIATPGVADAGYETMTTILKKYPKLKKRAASKKEDHLKVSEICDAVKSEHPDYDYLEYALECNKRVHAAGMYTDEELEEANERVRNFAEKMTPDMRAGEVRDPMYQ